MGIAQFDREYFPLPLIVQFIDGRLWRLDENFEYHRDNGEIIKEYFGVGLKSMTKKIIFQVTSKFMIEIPDVEWTTKNERYYVDTNGKILKILDNFRDSNYIINQIIAHFSDDLNPRKKEFKINLF